MRHTQETDEVFPHSYSFNNGYLHPGDSVGLGVDYNETLAEKFEYERAYLPVNRKLDGTMFNW
jgi:mannonate dehydratase